MQSYKILHLFPVRLCWIFTGLLGFLKSYSKFIQSIHVDTPFKNSPSLPCLLGRYPGRPELPHTPLPLVRRHTPMIHPVATMTVLREVRARSHASIFLEEEQSITILGEILSRSLAIRNP